MHSQTIRIVRACKIENKPTYLTKFLYWSTVSHDPYPETLNYNALSLKTQNFGEERFNKVNK